MDAEIVDDHKVETLHLAAVEGDSLALGLSRTEIDVQITTARRFPRQISRVSHNILSLATLDEDTAEECIYALPRGGKPIKGPSIRFAEIVKSQYGNCRAAARVVHVDRQEKVVIAEGIFHDLETNTATRAEVRRRISGREGRIFNDDMIIVTGNAACAIALRNAILGGVPKALWRKAAGEVEKTIAGDVKTLSVRREAAIKSMAQFGVKPEQVFTALGVAGAEDITLDHIPTLRGMFSALKNGEATVEEMFNGTIIGKSAHTKVVNPLSDSPQPQTGGAATEDSNPIQNPSVEAKTGSAVAAASADPVELSHEYGQALERAKTDKDVDAVVAAFKPNYDAAKKPVQKVMDGLLAEHRRRIKEAA